MNRMLTWTLPPISVRQAAHLHVIIDFRADPSLPWTTQGDPIPADQPQQLEFVDVNPGTFFYRGTVVDVAGNTSNGVTIEASAPYDPPGELENFTATDS